MLLLEDVDAAFVDRAAAGGAAGLSFSGLLNAIDGAWFRAAGCCRCVAFALALRTLLLHPRRVAGLLRALRSSSLSACVQGCFSAVAPTARCCRSLQASLRKRAGCCS